MSTSRMGYMGLGHVIRMSTLPAVTCHINYVYQMFWFSSSGAFEGGGGNRGVCTPTLPGDLFHARLYTNYNRNRISSQRRSERLLYFDTTHPPPQRNYPGYATAFHRGPGTSLVHCVCYNTHDYTNYSDTALYHACVPASQELTCAWAHQSGTRRS